jgi:hypothetical protein
MRSLIYAAIFSVLIGCSKSPDELSVRAHAFADEARSMSSLLSMGTSRAQIHKKSDALDDLMSRIPDSNPADKNAEEAKRLCYEIQAHVMEADMGMRIIKAADDVNDRKTSKEGQESVTKAAAKIKENANAIDVALAAR